jgi:hypothetical protein
MAEHYDYGPPLVDFSPISRIGDTFLRAAQAQREREESDKLAAALGLTGQQQAAPAAAQSAQPDAPAAPGPARPAFAGGDRRMVLPADPRIEQTAIATAKSLGLTNPYGLAAFAAHGNAESAFSPSRIAGSWQDPSKSGQPGTSGGLMSWRDPAGQPDRLSSMRAATAGAGDDPVAQTVAQTKFALTENPDVTVRLQNARSLEEAHAVLAGSQRYADYNVPGSPENAKRLQLAQGYLQRLGGPVAAPGGAPAASGGMQVPAQVGGIADPTTRAILATMLRTDRNKALGLMVSMRQKQATPPFEFQGGWYQADGEGKIAKVVDPQDRFVDERDADGNLIARNTRTNEAKLVTKPADRFVTEKDAEGNLIARNTVTGKTELVQAADPTARKATALGLKPTDTQVQASAFKPEGRMGATEMKMINEAEDSAVNLRSTIKMLERARELNPMIMTGPMASVRSQIGKLPASADQYIPSLGGITDPKAARATIEWEQMARPEAVAMMSTTLKGATTDREMGEFIHMFADPSIPVDIRERKLSAMLDKANAKLQLENARMQDIRGGTYFKTPAAKTYALPRGVTPDQAVAEARAAWPNATPLQRAQIQEQLNAWNIKTNLGE